MVVVGLFLDLQIQGASINEVGDELRSIRVIRRGPGCCGLVKFQIDLYLDASTSLPAAIAFTMEELTGSVQYIAGSWVENEGSDVQQSHVF